MLNGVLVVGEGQVLGQIRIPNFVGVGFVAKMKKSLQKESCFIGVLYNPMTTPAKWEELFDEKFIIPKGHFNQAGWENVEGKHLWGKYAQDSGAEIKSFITSALEEHGQQEYLRGRNEEREQWKEANELLRSTHSIAERKGKEVNWGGFLKRINEELKREHVIMYPENYVGMHENPAENDLV